MAFVSVPSGQYRGGIMRSDEEIISRLRCGLHLTNEEVARVGVLINEWKKDSNDWFRKAALVIVGAILLAAFIAFFAS